MNIQVGPSWIITVTYSNSFKFGEVLIILISPIYIFKLLVHFAFVLVWSVCEREIVEDTEKNEYPDEQHIECDVNKYLAEKGVESAVSVVLRKILYEPRDVAQSFVLVPS